VRGDQLRAVAGESAVVIAVLRLPAYETYGLVELAVAAGERQRGSLHWFPEFGYVEALGPDGEPSLDESGEIVATSLLDADMPLIRYRTGDALALGQTSEPCGCGRGLPRLFSIEGRRDDIVYAADGRPVTVSIRSSRETAHLRGQIVQEPGELLVISPIRAVARPAPPGLQTP
jgi:phenylacetate-coenzyme A ligase PaaK-like adenylate-forming protein